MAESPVIDPASAGTAATRRLPELLAPAGDWECVRAAVENGADAIYFGLDRFNARMRANNFTDSDLPKLMEFLHRRGVKGYITLNTLVFENELADAERYLRTMIAAGVDAVIVQDVGICRLIRELSPNFPVHASTQMTITSAAGVEFAEKLGCQLVVLARELSIKEIETIQSDQRSRNCSQVRKNVETNPSEPVSTFTSAATATMPLEVFVHGALCVAYSGQCLTSESLGGRSANRGECAQACRMPYDLISDGKEVPLGDRRYLLSPQDLAGVDVLPELARVGVASLKIEGRLKAPEYVANITRIYRKALDDVANTPEGRVPRAPNNPQTPNQSGSRGTRPSDSLSDDLYSMEMAFSRGLYTGWFEGINNQELVHARFGKKRGVYLGAITGVNSDSVTVKLENALQPGDGVVFDAGRPEKKEEGGRVYEVRTNPSSCSSRHATAQLTFGNNAIDFSRVHIGNKLWKTSDPALEKQWRQSFEGEKLRFQRPITAEVHGLMGKPLTVIARDEQGHVAQAESSMPLVIAETKPLSTDRLQEQLGRLGGTPFKLGELVNLIEGDLMLPVSELNRLRREVVTELERQRIQPQQWPLKKQSSAGVSPAAGALWPTAAPSSTKEGRSRRDAANDPRDAGATQTQLIALVRNLPQLEAALHCGVQTIYCDFENPKKYRDAVETFRTSHLAAQDCGKESGQSAIGNPQSAIYVAPPRIFKPGEEWQLEQVRSCNADGYLVRNYDHLSFFAEERRVGDYSLNVANHISADYFFNRFGLERVTASYDLNAEQLEALLQGAPPEWFEITLHQHMPMFHMEHCVFCAFLSTGKDYRDCGRPCDTHDVKLRDRVGAEHPLKADVGCRNTVFNSLAQTGAEYVERMLELGVRHFRIEFLNETPDEVEQTVAKYQQLLRGEITGTQLWRELKLFSQLGVTRGQMAGRTARAEK